MALASSRWLRFTTILAMAAVLAPMLATDVAAQDDGTPVAATEEVWFEATVPADALPQTGPVFLGLFRIVWEEGAGYRFQEDAPGVAVNCVLSGRFAFRPDRDELVVPADARPASRPAPAGVETTLEPGDCALLHQDVHRDERNAGTGPVDFVAVVILPENTPPPAGAPEAIEFAPLGYIYGGHWAKTPAGPTGPIRLTLRRVTLAPGATMPEQRVVGDAIIPVTDGTLSLTAMGGEPLVERAVSFTSEPPTPAPEGSETLLEAGDSAHIPDGAVVTLRNPGNAPVSWWFVTVVPVEEAATPSAESGAHPGLSLLPVLRIGCQRDGARFTPSRKTSPGRHHRALRMGEG